MHFWYGKKGFNILLVEGKYRERSGYEVTGLRGSTFFQEYAPLCHVRTHAGSGAGSTDGAFMLF